MNASRYPTPADLQNHTLQELAAAFVEHRGLLVDARHNLLDPAPSPPRIAAAALDALTFATAISRYVNHGRWLHVITALEHGATVEDVAVATGADADEVLLHTRLSADGQRRYKLITDVQHSEIVAVLDRAAGGAR